MSANPTDSKQPTSPYGPQHGRVDESAGGADSSPYEATPSGEKAAAANDPSTTRRQDADGGAGGKPAKDDPSVAPESGDRKATG